MYWPAILGSSIPHVAEPDCPLLVEEVLVSNRRKPFGCLRSQSQPSRYYIGLDQIAI